MKNFGYSNNLEYVNVDEYFSPEEKQLFLKIPHKIINKEKIDVIDFNVPENGKYPLLRNVTLINVKENLTDKELSQRDYSNLLYNTSNFDGEVGLFVQANHGSYVLDLIKELYQHDKDNARILFEEYLTEAVTCKDIIKISDMFVKQVQQMQDYLVKENIIVENLHLNYSELSKHFASLDEDTAYDELLNLQKKYGEPPDFPAYNDLDYTPMILEGDYCIFDSSGARLYIVKKSEDSQKIYMINRDRRDLNIDINEWLSDFVYEHNQVYILLKDTLQDSDLIAEIKDGKLIKASVEMKNMNLIQSFIVRELLESGKIIDNIPNLSFKELLENYTRQKEFYGIEERAIVPLLNNLILSDNKVTYTDFSLMPKDKIIQHENISDHTIETLLGKDKKGKKLSYIYTKSDFSKLKKLSSEFKTQIKEYLNELSERDNSDNAKILVDVLTQHLDITNSKTLKR